MERMARDAVETIKITSRTMKGTRRRLRQWALVVLLSLAAAAFALPRLQSAAAIALALLAYNVLTANWGTYAGPYAGIAARVLRTQMLFIEDSAGRARAWLGVENEFSDEKGARLVFYDDKGRARLAVRFADKVLDDPYGNGARAEVTPGQVADETYLPPPCPVGQPPSEETELKQRVKHAAHVAAVHVMMESDHACNWAATHLGTRGKEEGGEPEDSDAARPELVIFRKSGELAASLQSDLTLRSDKSLASVSADAILLMSDGKVVWEAPSPSRPA